MAVYAPPVDSKDPKCKARTLSASREGKRKKKKINISKGCEIACERYDGDRRLPAHAH